MKKFLLFGLVSLALSSCINQDEDVAVNSSQQNSKNQKTNLKQSTVIGGAVYRFYGGGMGHYYTTIYNDGINAGYTPEGVLGYTWLQAGGGNGPTITR
ncbi:hypothetical protein [Chryseobacterium sp. ISL-6]|uniref:hypothetical protein n=1 Tax=Chryseobacterium sp. ISL-6 TaxID=2819143 RepID=UPI001BEC9356|nr:hypothetical protein [Chryseobacterium sp. ISL-6]MBT2623695.1 hypothetical protein [Chryseobacterium sp. ISL-6]